MTVALVDPYPAYLTAGTGFQRMAPLGTGTQLVYATFDEDPRQLLPFVDTGLIYPAEGGQQGDPSLCRYFNFIRFGGAGKLYARVFVDSSVVQQGFVTLAEDSNQASILHLPRGTAGFGIRLQLVGLAWWRYFAIDWDPVSEGGL